MTQRESPQGVTQMPQGVVTHSQQAVTPGQQAVTPASQAVTPASQAVTPASQAVMPASQAVLPRGVREVPGAIPPARPALQVRWGAVIAGLFVAVGTFILVILLGLAVGLAGVEPGMSPLSALTDGAGLWVAMASIIALFLGGYTAGRLSGAVTGGEGAVHGVLMWASWVVHAIWIATLSAGLLIGGASMMMPGIGQLAIPAAMAQQPTVAELQAQATGEQVALRLDAAQARPASGFGMSDAARTAWATFTGAVLLVLAAAAGGAVGARDTAERRVLGRRSLRRRRDDDDDVMDD